MGKGSKLQHRKVSDTRPLPTLPISWAAQAGQAASYYPLSVVEAAGIAAVRRCVTLICNAIAGSPWTQWRNDEKVPNSRIVDRPARLMTRREWVWRAVAQMMLTDVSYIYLTGGVDDEGVPGSLIPLPKEVIQPAGYIDPYGIFPPTAYSISGVSGVISAEYVIPMRSVFWPGVPPHLAGILNMSRAVLMQAWASDAYGAKYWQGGGAPTTVITTDQELTNAQADQIGERWRDRRSKGPDFPAVIGKGGKAEPWGADVAALSAVEARREIAIEIANLFGVPARYVNVAVGGTAQTYANLNDESLSLERYTLTGFVDPIEDCISDLLPTEDRMRVDMSRLTRAGQEARFRAWATALGNKPWIVGNEVRRIEGFGPSAEIDTLVEAQVEGAEAAVESFAAVGQGGQGGINTDNEQEQESANASA